VRPDSLAFDHVDELELLRMRGRLLRFRNQTDFLVTDCLEHTDHECVPCGHPREHVLKRGSARMPNRMGRQCASQTSALLSKAGGGLGRQPSVPWIGAGSREHLPANHRSMAVLGDPELKYIVLRTQRAVEELVEQDLARKPTVPVLRVRLADPNHRAQV